MRAVLGPIPDRPMWTLSELREYLTFYMFDYARSLEINRVSGSI